MRRYIYSLMTDGENGFLQSLLKAILSVVSFGYLVIVSLRNFLYDADLFRAQRAPCKVISVGNLTLGGTGKTPFCIMLARLLKGRLGKKVCVLIRGYGWDEQEMLKRELEGIPVLVGRDRVRNALRAGEEYAADVIVLDDGFQHRRLKRDLDIILIDTRNPFGNGSLFPRGILREPLSGVKRASIAVLTKVNKGRFDKDEIKEGLRKANRGLLFFEALHSPLDILDGETKRPLGTGHLKGKRALLVSSIGDPAYFEETVRDLAAEVPRHIVYPDHHDYRDGDIEAIRREFADTGADCVVTTEKDIVKLEAARYAEKGLRLLVLRVEMKIINGEEEFVDRLRSRVGG